MRIFTMKIDSMANSIWMGALLILVALSSSACAQKPADKLVGKAVSIAKSQAKPGEPDSNLRSVANPDSKSSEKSIDKSKLATAQAKKIESLKKAALKSFAAAELTDEQQSVADEAFAKAFRSFVLKRDEAMISDELIKGYSASLKAAKKSSPDSSPEDQASVALESAGFTPEQIKVFVSTQKAIDKAKRDIAKKLTADQIDKLPKSLQKIVSGSKA